MQNLIQFAAASSKLLPFRPAGSGSRPIGAAPAAQPHPSAPLVAMAKPAQLPSLSPSAKLAHDARNTLCSLQMLTGLLGEPGVLQTSFARYASDLQSVTAALHSLVDKLASAAEAAPAGLPSPLHSRDGEEDQLRNAGEALQACESLLQMVAGPAVAVHVSSERALPPLTLDDDALSRVLVNLVKNASEAMGVKGGTVRITARRALSQSEPAVLLHISDNGPGIPAHALGQIFEPGFSSKRSAKGPCGLGLAIVRELVEACGGAVEVASTRHRGTTFELRIPTSPK